MSQLEIRCHTGREAMHQLGPALAAAGLLPTPVPEMEPAYLAAGFEGDNPAALVGYRHSRAVAYLPFSLRPNTFRLGLGPLTVGRLPYRQLRLLGYHAAAPEGVQGREVLDAFFLRLLGGHPWHVASIYEFPRDTPLYELLTQSPSPLGQVVRVVCETFDTFRVTIRGTFESYLQERFTSKSRYTLRRTVKALEAHARGRLAIKRYTTDAEVDPFVIQADTVARRTYQHRLGHTVVRDTPQWRLALEHQAQANQLRSYVLQVRERPIAYLYGATYDRRFAYKIVGYDPEQARLSPGTVLLYRVLEDLFGSHEVDELDFGPTFADYKRRFSTTKGWLFNARLYRTDTYPLLLGHIEHAWEGIKAQTGRWSRQLGARRLLLGADGSAAEPHDLG